MKTIRFGVNDLAGYISGRFGVDYSTASARKLILNNKKLLSAEKTSGVWIVRKSMVDRFLKNTGWIPDGIPNPKGYISTAEMAKRTGKSGAWIRKLAYRGKLDYIRRGRLILVKEP